MIQIISNKINSALSLVVIKIVNITCQMKIINKENKHPMYHKLLHLLALHASHLQK